MAVSQCEVTISNLDIALWGGDVEEMERAIWFQLRRCGPIVSLARDEFIDGKLGYHTPHTTAYRYIMLIHFFEPISALSALSMASAPSDVTDDRMDWTGTSETEYTSLRSARRGIERGHG